MIGIDQTPVTTATGLPRRDWVLLPLISLLTVIVMLGGAEILARRVWAENESDGCLYVDSSVTFRHYSNCTTTLKNAEGPLLTYRFNSCGYRTEEPCGPKPQGTLRIAVLGDSDGMGVYVPYESMFTVQAAKELRRLCGCPVEFQNLSSWGRLTGKYRLGPEIVNLHPDALVLVVSSYDLDMLAEVRSPDAASQEGDKPRQIPHTASPFRRVLSQLMKESRDSRVFLVAQHYLLADDRLLTMAYQAYSHEGDVLHKPCTPKCEAHYFAFEVFLRNLSGELKNSAIPIVILPVPNRITAAVLSDRIQVSGMDPDGFADRVGQIAKKHGIQMVEDFSEFRRTPHSQRLYYTVDGHPREGIQSLLARALVNHLVAHSVDGSLPSLSKCASGAGSN